MSTLLVAVVALADAGALVWLWPHLAVVTHLPRLHAWLDQVGTDHAAVELCQAGLWVVAAWLGVGMTASAAAALPGVAGRLGGGIAHAVLPRTLYRIVAGTAGLGVLVTPALAAAAPTSPAASVASSATPTPTPYWPTDAPVPTPHWPTDATAHRGEHRPTPPQHRRPSHPDHHPDAARTVVVQSGDSLWRIAAEHLSVRPTPRRIAAAWPRWYAANRPVIGDDPNVIVPGQHLHPPSEHTAPSEARP
jgi:hypothetical protein